MLIGINGRKNKLRIYYLSWLKQKILKGDEVRVTTNAFETTVTCSFSLRLAV